MPVTKIKHEGGLGGAAHDRGISFLEAAQSIILDNLSEAQIEAINEKKDFPLRKEFGLEQNNKNNIELLQDYIASLGVYWTSLTKDDLNGKELAVLERTLIETISKNIYFLEPKDKKQESNFFKRVKIELDNAENHVNWNPRSPKSSETEGMARTETPISKFTPDITREWLKIITNDKPRWFKALPEWEQNYFTKRVKDWQAQESTGVSNLGDYLGPVPTTIRKYPGAPNAYVTEVKLQEADGSEITFTKIRSGVIAPAAMKVKNKQDQDEKIQIAKQNLEQLLVVALQEKIKQTPANTQLDDLPILLQTLYTPPIQPPGKFTNESVMAALALMREDLAKGTKAFIDKHQIETNGITFGKIDLLYSNQAVNKGRNLAWLYNLGSKQGSETRHTANALASYVDKLAKTPENDMVRAALKSYQKMPYIQNTLGSLFSTKNNALAEKAALEQIIAGKVGIRVGSCVSGKDREEMITEIAIAQQQFFLKYKQFPPPYNASGPQKELRDKFEELVARQYLTGHGHELAAENSKGCDGLKNIKDVMGDGICAKIKKLAQKEYGIDTKKFDPIKHVQKVAGFNKLNTKKLNVKIDDLKEKFVNSNFFQMVKQDKATSKDLPKTVTRDERQVANQKRSSTIGFAFRATQAQNPRRNSAPAVMSSSASVVDDNKLAAITACKAKLDEYIKAITNKEKPEGLKYNKEGNSSITSGDSHAITVLKYIRDNLHDDVTKERVEELAKAGTGVWHIENNPLNDLAKALDTPKRSKSMDI